MLIELVEVLRCIRAHDESWLVASIDELRDRSIKRGTLGCPVCSAEYPIVDGVADFSAGNPIAPPAANDLSGEEIAMRAGAFLGLAGATGLVALGGIWARGADVLARSVDVRVVALNPSEGLDETPGVALVRAAEAIPLAAGSCAGVAIDVTFSAAALLSARRAVCAGGRIVGSREVALPDGLTMLAEDESWWVAEKPPDITTLRRGSR